jgi:hypothetical protein
MANVKTDWSDLKDDEAFLRTVIFPEEDRRLFTTAPWGGGFRWFRSPNVVPLERYREKVKSRNHDQAA